MEHGSIERQVHVGAAPEVVYDVVSDPGHVARWWSLRPDGDGTLRTVTEEGLREQGWEAAALEEYYLSHRDGRGRRLGELADYAAELVTRR